MKILLLGENFMIRMSVSAHTKILSLAMLVAAFIFASGIAYAVQIFDLTNTNTNPAIDITVRVTVSDGCAGAGDCTLRLQFISDNLTNTPLGFDQFGYNSGTLNSPLLNPAAQDGWSNANCPAGPGGCQMDGFGRFTAEVDEPAGEDLDITFILASDDNDYPFNANNGNFAVHIRYGDNCSLFVSNGTSNDTAGGSGCSIETDGASPTDVDGASPTDVVPEPSTLLVFGAGLIVINRFARKSK
jgi:PEP-CTERM motif